MYIFHSHYEPKDYQCSWSYVFAPLIPHWVSSPEGSILNFVIISELYLKYFHLFLFELELYKSVLIVYIKGLEFSVSYLRLTHILVSSSNCFIFIIVVFRGVTVPQFI